MSSTGVSDSNPLFETLRLQIQDKITALANGGQSVNPLLDTFGGYRVTTVASNNDSITLPKAMMGSIKLVTNAAAANSLNVFPNKGDQINTAGVNAAFAMTAGKVALFVCMSTGQWHSILTA